MPSTRQRGVAVITALLLTTLAITIVASLFWQQQVQVRSIENQRLQLQKQWILRGALDWARLILREDARFSSVDNLDEPWAVPLSDTRLDQYVENGRADTDAADAILSGSIIDAQSRLNLANLSANGEINQGEVAAFERLLTNVQLNPQLARATAQMMAETQTKPVASGQNSGARPLGLAYVDDLLAVPGFTPPALEKLREFVIFLPRSDVAVNANTAPAEVLAAKFDGMTVSEANALIVGRKTASFKSGDPRLSAKEVVGRQLDVKTNYFLVNGTVKMSRAGLGVQALIERNGTITKLVWVRES
ncbi:type II secretion system minor pseudopilin GspK [Oxalobacteraceae bacterium R-40]|uniref:Type II secretion system protein K n=1 Tax=Keguizhuia sedimenti TaxID=3064264 RepID=A0ABU1BKX5_9BURK|nr:type II secretion system minor pseudopilin GspK [Oxalobacteraceae bacterium R-40]